VKTKLVQLHKKTALSGRIDNPLWQILDHSYHNSKECYSDSSVQKMKPLEFFQEDSFLEIDSDDFRTQTFLEISNFKKATFIDQNRKCQRIQIWIDRVVTSEEAAELKELYLQNKNLELVYLPNLHYHPQEIFKNLQMNFNLIVHLKVKESNFDSWLSSFELWDRILWLKEDNRFNSVGLQIFEEQLDFCRNEAEKSFLLGPSYESLLKLLKTENNPKYRIQATTKTLFQLASPQTIFFLRHFFWTILNPHKQNWLTLFGLVTVWYRRSKSLLLEVLKGSLRYCYYGFRHAWRLSIIYLKWDFKNLIIFYPFKKIYWFFNFQFKKRLKKERCS
jgi:hypothetical protein